MCDETALGAAVYGVRDAPDRRTPGPGRCLHATPRPAKGGPPHPDPPAGERPDQPTHPARRSPLPMRPTLARLALAAAVFAVMVGAAHPAFAAAAPAPSPPPQLSQVIDNARLWVMGLLTAVATLFFVIGGARYVMAGGDPSQVERAKQTIKAALAGYALAVLAPVALAILQGIVGG